MSNLAPFVEPGAAVQISGDVVQQASGAWLASGIVPNISGQSALISGQNVVVSSGAISVVSGSITVNSGQIAISGIFAGFSGAQKFISGGAAVSGAVPVVNLFYDFSGAQWLPQMVGASGYSVPLTMIADAGGVGGGGNSLGNYARVQNPNITLAGPGLTAASFMYGWDPVIGIESRMNTTASGDLCRLRVSPEGRAPTYVVNAPHVQLISGGAAAQVGPIITLFNYGSGTATPVYHIKSLYISPDPASSVSGVGPVKFDIIRIKNFSGMGGGTLLSGIAYDTNDPAYSGTLAGPTIGQLAVSGYQLDGILFSYIINANGLNNAAYQGLDLSGHAPSTAYSLWAQIQDTNLINDFVFTKDIAIRSGYGFAVVQSSGNGYTAAISGLFNFTFAYSVEA